MPRKKAINGPETPILAYSSFSEKELDLVSGTRTIFARYAKFFSEKSGQSLQAEDVLSAKALELSQDPERLEIPRAVTRKLERITLPNGAWQGIMSAAKVNFSSPNIVIEALAGELEIQPEFRRWSKKKTNQSSK